MKLLGRNLNFTKRARVPRERLRFRISGGDGKAPPRLEIDGIDLSGLEIAPECRLFLDARARDFFHRLDLGTAARPERGPFDLPAAILSPRRKITFRFIAVDTETMPPRITASQERVPVIRPGETELGGKEEALLPLKTADLGEMVWMVEWEDGRPWLVLNRSVPDPEGKMDDPHFAPLVLPAALHQILVRLGMEDSDADWDDENRELWRQFASRWEEPPEDESGQWNEWVRGIVESFCREHRFLTEFRRQIEGGEE